MWDQDRIEAPTVYRLCQNRGPIAERSLRRSEHDWPITLDDCQSALISLLSRMKLDADSYPDYWIWVSRTRTEMSRLYELHRESCRQRQQWDLPGLLRLRCRLEIVTLRLYCAPWFPSGRQLPALSLQQFTRLTA